MRAKLSSFSLWWGARMQEWKPGENFELCMGVMTALAIITDILCKSGRLDRAIVVDQIIAAQDMARGERRIPLSMFQLLLELLD